MCQVSDLISLRYHRHLTEFEYGKYRIILFCYGSVSHKTRLASVTMGILERLQTMGRLSSPYVPPNSIDVPQNSTDVPQKRTKKVRLVIRNSNE